MTTRLLDFVHRLTFFETHDVSETESVFVFRYKEGGAYSVGAFRES
jgi:hypothetical protein